MTLALRQVFAPSRLPGSPTHNAAAPRAYEHRPRKPKRAKPSLGRDAAFTAIRPGIFSRFGIPHDPPAHPGSLSP